MNTSRQRKQIASAICILIAAASLLKGHRETKQRRWWVRPWLNQTRGNIGLTQEFITSDIEKYSNYLRMDENTFEKLLSKIAHRITKKSFRRETISARCKLIITLRYLATGESFRSLMYNYRISESTISLFIPTVCRAIYEELKNEYLKVQFFILFKLFFFYFCVIFMWKEKYREQFKISL